MSNPGVREREEKLRCIKIAIIDNGVNAEDLELQQGISDVIERGVTFVKDNADLALPWRTDSGLHSDPHGTLMASLVAATNPWCRLYIARVGKDRQDIDPEVAARAVDWALEQNVDIISISWTTETQSPALKEAIEKAARRTLIFCSTADQVARSDQVFPADYEGAVRVSATGKFDNLIPASDEKGHAVNIHVPVKYMPDPSLYYIDESSITLSSSSVATALAAGIASLSLSMLLVFNDIDKNMLRKKGIYQNKKIAALLSMAISPTDTSQSLFPTGPETTDLPSTWNLDAIMSKIDELSGVP
ncbi:peptidase S8/S53 domain-containing protein [Ustulina deusta]|nr:peptidase S8/S53 domain-containing protein [Ustulina deusta]